MYDCPKAKKEYIKRFGDWIPPSTTICSECGEPYKKHYGYECPKDIPDRYK